LSTEKKEEKLIRAATDGEEILVRDINDPISTFKEVVLRSKSRRKQVRTVYAYKEVIHNKKLVGRELRGQNKTLETFGTQKQTTLQVI